MRVEIKRGARGTMRISMSSDGGGGGGVKLRICQNREEGEEGGKMRRGTPTMRARIICDSATTSPHDADSLRGCFSRVHTPRYRSEAYTRRSEYGDYPIQCG